MDIWVSVYIYIYRYIDIYIYIYNVSFWRDFVVSASAALDSHPRSAIDRAPLDDTTRMQAADDGNLLIS